MLLFSALTLILLITAASVPGFNNVDDDAVETILASNTTRDIIVSAISLVSFIGANCGRVVEFGMEEKAE
jgi:hypothetical protein